MASNLLVLAACTLFGPSPTTINSSLLRLAVQTQNGISTFSYPGDIISYQYLVTNAAKSPLAGPVIVIDASRQVECPAVSTTGNLDNFLDFNETIICTASYTITQADITNASVTNVSVATAGGVVSNQSSITLVAATGTHAAGTYSPGPTAGPTFMTTHEGLATLPVTGATSPVLEVTSMSTQDLNTVAQATVTNLPKANYEYRGPTTLSVDNTDSVELRLSRLLDPSQLSTLIVTANALATSTSQPGTVVAPGGSVQTLGRGQVEVTPRMKIELQPEDPEAFEIYPQTGPIQDVNPNATVIWRWSIKAKKPGIQRLVFLISRQASVGDEDRFFLMDTQTRTIEVDVTIGQQLGSIGWGWITALLLLLAAISAVWLGAGPRQREAGRSLARGRDGGPDHRPMIKRGEASSNQSLGHVFVSYRRSDSADIAGRIYDSLVDEFGIELIFKDVYSIPLGTDFKEYLAKKVSECKVLLAIIGDRWVDARGAGGKKRLDDPADFVRVEIESALERGIPVIPLLVRGAQMPDAESLPPSLGKLVYKNGIPIRPDPDFHHDMDRLISALEEYIQ